MLGAVGAVGVGTGSVGVEVVGVLVLGVLVVGAVGVLVEGLVGVLFEEEGLVVEVVPLPDPPPQEASIKVARAAQERVRKVPVLNTTLDIAMDPLEK